MRPEPSSPPLLLDWPRAPSRPDRAPLSYERTSRHVFRLRVSEEGSGSKRVREERAEQSTCASSKGQNRCMHADELADLLRWCAALSTDPADLAGAVVLAAGPRWPRLVDSPQDLRELTVHTFLRPAKPSDTVARQGIDRIPDELRAVVTAYDKLPKLQRVAVMLSCLEGVTYAEIAGIVDRSTARIGIELDRALAAINADPYEVRAALDMITWQVPAPVEISRSLRRHTRIRTHRRRRIGLTGVAAVTMLVVFVTISAVHRPYVEPRQSGAWTFSHTVRPTPGWSIQSRTVERDWETTILRADPPDGNRCAVSVGTAGASWVRQLPRKPTTVRVGTRTAFYAEGVWPNGGGAMLWWEYADTAWVIIECGSVTNPRKALPELASHVTLTPEPILLPYRIRSLPPALSGHVDHEGTSKQLDRCVAGSQRLSRGHHSGQHPLSSRLADVWGQQFQLGISLRQRPTRRRLPTLRGQPHLRTRRPEHSRFHRHRGTARRHGHD